jgi:acetyltransferase
LVDSLLRVGQLAVDFPEISELDVNPFIVYDKGQGGLAVDMRLVVRPADARGGGQAAQPPGSAT